MAEPAALELENVVKAYGRVPAVNGVSLRAQPGEFVTILGPSGSGKTTLLMTIAGFILPDSGRVLFRGENVTWLPAHLRNVGVVFQNYALFPHMNVHDNVAFPLRMRNVDGQRARIQVNQALELVHMDGHGARLTSQLSGGQQQRVALARALVFQPTLLLMDEPLGALDRNLRERMQLEIKSIQRATGVTIIYVTHDQQEALVLSDRIVVMDGGRIRMEGSAEEVYERPSDTFVAQFIGETNLLRGPVVTSADGRSAARLGPGLDVPLGERGAGQLPGAVVVLCVRPERVRCAVGSTGTAVCFPARVEGVTYLGDMVKYHALLEGSTPAVTVVGKQLAETSRPRLRVGDRTTIGWNDDDAWILKEATP